MSFTFLFHIFLAFTLLNTFHTYSFGGAVFIMHSCPHSGLFCSLSGSCCKGICSPVINSSLASPRPDCCRNGALERVFLFYVCTFDVLRFPEKKFKKVMNKPALFFSFFFPVARLELSVQRGITRWARLCCCWSRGCFACCRYCGPRCCSLRWAGASGSPVCRLSHLLSTQKGREDGKHSCKWWTKEDNKWLNESCEMASQRLRKTGSVWSSIITSVSTLWPKPWIR